MTVDAAELAEIQTAAPADRASPDQCGRNPAAGADDDRHVTAGVSSWTVVATHPQAERWAEANISRAGYRTYLPLVAGKKRDRAIRTMFHDVLLPLFPGYLFAEVGSADPWTPIRYAPGVRSLIIYGNRLQYARAGAVEALQAGEEFRREVPQGAAAWRVGASCAILGGVFEGAAAVVVELRGLRAVVALISCGALTRAVVELSALGPRC
jgi:transcriptional antiterminator RfaH